MENFRWPAWIRENRVVAMISGGLITLVLLIWAVSSFVARLQGPAAMPKSRLGVEVIGFYQNNVKGSGTPGSRASFDAHARQLTQVSPLWYSVSPTGSVTDTGYDASLVAAAHARQIKVVPLFVNAGGRSNVLLSATMRTRAAKNIESVVRADHLDGASIDFELLKPQSRTDLSLFIRDLFRNLKPLHKIVAVSVFPLKGLSTSVNGAYDYKALAAHADYLVIMAYDHHYSGGPPGPVAPYAWVKENVVQAVHAAPKNRLVLAIGMYGYDWVNNGRAGAAPTVADVTAKAMAKSYGVPIRYIASESQNTFTYTKNGTSHVVWFMGDRSAKARVALARQYHLRGIALWRLGMEDPGFWKNVP